MDDMDNITRNSLQIAGATSLASLAAGLGCWLWLPDKIEFWGSITMPKEVGILLIPVLGIVLTLMLALVVKCDPLCENLDSSSQAAMSVIVMSPSLFSPVLQVIVLWAAFTEHSLGITLVAFLFSVFLVMLGGSFNYVEQNHVVGIRDPWTLASARVWEEVHCLATKLFILAGLVGMVAVWFIPPGLWQLILMGAITLVPLIICSVYSFLIREDAQYQYIVR